MAPSVNGDFNGGINYEHVYDNRIMLVHPLAPTPNKNKAVLGLPCRQKSYGKGRMASASSHFSEEQFRDVCLELQQPGVPGDNWELLVTCMGISIYQRLNQPSGHYEYKAFGVLEDCPPGLLTDVYLDFNYRKNWDDFVKQLYEEECNGEVVIYWELNCPSPKFNRDYVYVQQHREMEFNGQKVHVILAQNTSVPQFPEKSGVLRVRQYKQRLAFQSNGRNGSKIFVYYYDSLDCPVPNWLFKWAAKKGVPTYLRNMVNACHNYPRRS
ncbi:phosphatidylcholine transfer protein-like [Hippopotamus amphibius kiboko]|uniref:phosphatidylcholine transfer protein-like n=1 Tax=Hippopotamus amphibius kiboko TaxID=575201 RepID=UPI00259159C3|nr:phosphatidylcholine transfer protein-like [Hippopotamus amphibius kiboko]